MPYITLQDPFGSSYHISTRDTERILHAWFDEVLPHAHLPAEDGRDAIWPLILVYPMWAWGADRRDADWILDSRALGRFEEFPARNGDEGLAELVRIRHRLELELHVKSLPPERGRSFNFRLNDDPV